MLPEAPNRRAGRPRWLLASATQQPCCTQSGCLPSYRPTRSQQAPPCGAASLDTGRRPAGRHRGRTRPAEPLHAQRCRPARPGLRSPAFCSVLLALLPLPSHLDPEGSLFFLLPHSEQARDSPDSVTTCPSSSVRATTLSPLTADCALLLAPQHPACDCCIGDILSARFKRSEWVTRAVLDKNLLNFPLLLIPYYWRVTLNHWGQGFHWGSDLPPTNMQTDLAYNFRGARWNPRAMWTPD